MARGGRAGGRSGGRSRGRSFRRGHHAHGGRRSTPGGLARAMVMLVIAMIINVLEPRLEYNEAALEQCAAQHYEQVFGKSEAYEDNLVLTFVVWPDNCDYSYITWVGDHVNDTTYDLLGGNESYLGQTLSREISESYEYSLCEDLEQTLALLAEQIRTCSPKGCYTCDEDHSGTGSVLINNSRVSLHENRLQSALDAFTEAMGIPIALVIEDAETLFGEAG